MNPYESPSTPGNAGMAGVQFNPPATPFQLACNWLALSGGSVLGAYIAVAMSDGLASAIGRGIPPVHLFAPVCVVAIGTTTMWRWLRFRGAGAYALEPIVKFISGAFAACATWLVMTQLDASNLADRLLPLLPLPLFVVTCVTAVEVEGALRRAFSDHGTTGRSLT